MIEGLRRDVTLARYSTFRVGGPADFFVEARSAEAVRAATAWAARSSAPVTLLGGGSNVLIADSGVRGLVIRMHGGDAREIGDGVVRADAGMTINGLVRWTIGRGVAGLEAWAGTPGTVGGAIHGNAHFRGHSIGERVDAVELADRDDVRRVRAAEMGFSYDHSRVQTTGEVVLSADFRVGRGDTAALRGVARESLAFRKRTQPLDVPSAGCIFQNPDPVRDSIPAGLPHSAGALIDRAGLKAARIGGASVSATHANFIVTDGAASASDIRALIDACRDGVLERFGVELREEIVYVGFEEQ